MAKTPLDKLLDAIDKSIEGHTGGDEMKSMHESVTDGHIVNELKRIRKVYDMANKKINWYEKPETVNMTNAEIERTMRDQDNYFDTFPNAWNTDWESQHETEAMIYDDEGIVYLKAKRQSKNSWRVRTTFN